MGSHIICIVLIVAVQFSAGLGRNHNYEYYISKYHHKSSTALSSSIAGFSPDVTTESSVSDDSLENIKHSSTGDNSVETIKLSPTGDIEHTPHRNRTGHSNEYDEIVVNYSDHTQLPGKAIGIIVGCVYLSLAVCSCCIFICFKVCRRRSRNAVRRGFVIANRAPIPEPVAQPHQPTTSQEASPPPAMGHQYPPQQYHNQQPQSIPAPSQYQEERQLLFPPQYQPQTMQQSYQSVQNHHQSQSSPEAPMDHNPPEAPPPYDFPEKF